MKPKIIDLHCDLLSYLAEKAGRSPQDTLCRTSYPQMAAGGLHIQTLAIFTKTGVGSTLVAKKQIDLFKALLRGFPLYYSSFSKAHVSSTVQIIPSIENASGFAEESEPISLSLERLEKIHTELKHLVYISLTWNEENRFGGGNDTSIGLKEDGKRLLDWMGEKKIAIDFSHTSDRLAEEILTYIDHQALNIPLLASHSNFRAITPLARNLPEWLARELIRRKGKIGLNLFAPFIHATDPQALMRHVEYALSLGGEDSLCFGADFFYEADFPSLQAKYQTKTPFFAEYADASCYPMILKQLFHTLHLKEELIQKIACDNILQLINSLEDSIR